MWKNIVRHAVPYEKLRQEEHGMGRSEGTKAHLHRFARVVIRFDSQLLQLWYNGDKLIDGLRCEWYEPEAHWTWALGARTGQRADDHFLRNLTMVSSDYALDPGAITLEVSLNDQDYTGPDDYTAEAADGNAVATPRGPKVPFCESSFRASRAWGMYSVESPRSLKTFLASLSASSTRSS